MRQGLAERGCRHNHFQRYYHLFYAVRPQPPYDVTHVSYPFRMRREWPNDRADYDRIQFAAGLARSGSDRAATLTLSYGVGDCVAAEVNISAAHVWQMLEGTLIKLELLYHAPKTSDLHHSWGTTQ